MFVHHVFDNIMSSLILLKYYACHTVSFPLYPWTAPLAYSVLIENLVQDGAESPPI
jgi:hypothetical protein